MNLKPVLQFIVTNPIRKIFAIAFAFGLWFFVALDSNYQYARNIKVAYTKLPDSLIVVDSVSSISLVFNGRGGSLLSTWAAPPKAICNLNQVEIGKNEIPINELNIPVAFSDLSINYNTPAINVTVDWKVSEIAKITVPVKGSLKEGYSINDIVVLDTIRVNGPREILSTLDAIATETLNVKNKSASFTKGLKIKKTSSLFQISKQYVQIKVEVDTAVKKLFTNIPLKLIFTPAQRPYVEKINLDTLIVEGPKKRIGTLRKKDIDVKIKLTTLGQGEYNLPATIIVPDYIKPVYSKPQKFKIKIY